MSELLVADEVKTLLRNFAPQNEEHVTYLPISNCVLVFNAETSTLQVYEEDFTDFETLDEEVQLFLYDYVFTNRFALGEFVQDKLVMLQAVEDMSWIVEPVPIYALNPEQGKPPIEMGAFAIAREMQLESKELRSVLFISPDKTYATLTAYMSDQPDEVVTAKADLLLIAEEMKKFIERL